MALAQVYGARSEMVEPAGRLPAGHSASGVGRFGALAGLARAISAASGACIRIEGAGTPQTMFFPPLDEVTDLPPALVRGEAAGASGEAGLPGMRFWAGFPLRGPDGVVLGLLGIMDAAPRVLSQDAIGQLQLLAEVLAEVLAHEMAAEAGAARDLAARALRLVEDVTELDNEAASPSLRGLLRFAAGGTPNSTEAMALRIAGLAEAKAGKLVLTHVAEGILSHQGFEQAAVNDTVADTGAVVASAADGGTDFVAMARLRIGEVNHLIARSEALGALGFRPGGGETDWHVLLNGLEEGWPEIIAEVLRETRDVVGDYVRMHMIHERDAKLPEGQYRYDLYGMGWTVRGTPEFAEVSVNGQDWVAFDASGVAWDQPRDLSARAAMAGYPDIGARIGTDVHEWCKRIAAGSEVTPIF